MNHHHHPRPERRRGETIDETIDRVAAQLTMVPADPALAGRIADRLATRTFALWPRLVIASAVVAAVAILAMIVSNDTREMPAVDVARSTPPEPTARVEPPAAVTAGTSAATVAAVGIAPQGGVRPRRAASMADDPLPEMRQIDPLTSPALLAFDTLARDTLTITPVDLAPLGLANLSVSDIADRDSPKE